MSTVPDGSNTPGVPDFSILPVSFAERIQLRQMYSKTGCIQDLIDLIQNKPVHIFTRGQLQTIEILKTFL
jgi:hypothetical protein